MRPTSSGMSLLIRTAVPPLIVVNVVRGETRRVIQAIYEVCTMEQRRRASLDRQRFPLLLFGIFAGLGFAARLHWHLRRAGLLNEPACAGNRRSSFVSGR